MLDILPFHKISRPVYEGGVSIDLKPKGRWFVEVRRTDGTIRYPYGDRWIDNLFLNQFANGLLEVGVGPSGLYLSGGTEVPLLKALLYGSSNLRADTISIGTSAIPPSVTQTGLQGFVKNSTTISSTGNSATVSPTTGDVVMTKSMTFAAEVGSASYNEAGVNPRGANGPLGISSGSRLTNRVVFPSPLNVTVGEIITLTCAITIPSLAVTPQVITIAAQNGVNISGQLKVIGTEAALCGGTITAGGSITDNSDGPLLPKFGIYGPPLCGLTTASTFPAFGTNTTGMNANPGTAAFDGYTTDSRYRDLTATWGVGTPAVDTDFQSITFMARSNTGINGYQLLLDNEMTKQAAATLSLSLRFSV